MVFAERRLTQKAKPVDDDVRAIIPDQTTGSNPNRDTGEVSTGVLCLRHGSFAGNFMSAQSWRHLA